jgi:hypothetical protein
MMSDCILALVIQHKKRMHGIILPSVACLAVSYLSTLSQKRYDLKKKFVNLKFMILVLL